METMTSPAATPDGPTPAKAKREAVEWPWRISGAHLAALPCPRGRQRFDETHGHAPMSAATREWAAKADVAWLKSRQ